MKKGWLVVLLLAVIIMVGLIALFVVPAPTANAPTGATNGVPVATSTATGPHTGTVAQHVDLNDTIVVDAPKQGVAVASPLMVTGKARGTFYFEASFPVKLLDANGNVLAQGAAKAQSDWMTTDFVPFSVTLKFVQPAPGAKGTLVLMNDNPSGDPDKQLKLEIPVQF